MVDEKECYLLTEAAEIIGCEVCELVEVIDSWEINVGIQTEQEWYFWEIDGGISYPPVQGVRFVEFADWDDFKSIMTVGFHKIDFFENGHLSTNPRFKYGGVVVKKEQLAISKTDFLDITEPSSPEEIERRQKLKCSLENERQADEVIQADQARGITQTERQTMLKLIIGMAIDAYGYDPEATRNSATGEKNGISAKLKIHGISINDDTIRKYLIEAKEIL